MSEQHTALLKTARERLVEDRRAFAKIIAAPFEREKTRDAREKFIDIQAAIEAVDRAIEDEDRQAATAVVGVGDHRLVRYDCRYDCHADAVAADTEGESSRGDDIAGRRESVFRVVDCRNCDPCRRSRYVEPGDALPGSDHIRFPIGSDRVR